MLNKIDHALEILAKAKRDKKTMTMVIGCVISFGVAVGAIAVYEHLIRELDASNGQSYFRREGHMYHEDEDEYDY